MAFDSLLTTIPAGTDKIAGKSDPGGAGFLEGVVVGDSTGLQINPASRENQLSEIALLQSLDGNAHGLRQILKTLQLLAMAINSTGELKVNQSGSSLGTVGTVTAVTSVGAVSNVTLMGGISPSMDQYYASRAACAAINSRVL